jgi:hypothetical protein
VSPDNSIKEDVTANNDMYRTLHELYSSEGELAYNLAVFGDYIAKREGYKEYHDMDAVRYYLIEKFKWTPSTVRSMSYEDIMFVLAEEMAGWVLPQEAID